MRMLMAAAVVMMTLSGCTDTLPGGDGSGGSYPESYMLASSGVPAGYELVGTESDMWRFLADGWGLEENPGWADPEAFENNDSIPVPERLRVAFYVTEGWDSESEEQPTIILSMAIEMASGADADEAVSHEDFCQQDQEDTYTTIQRDGVYFSGLTYFGPDDLTQELDSAAGDIRGATGAQQVC